MSSLYVRETVRGWLRDTPGLILPFFDTVNQEQHPDAPAWSTLLFVNANASKVTYCGHIEERGTFDFLALARPGGGDAALLRAAEHDAAILLACGDARLTLLHAGPPDDFLQAGGVPWYTVAISIDYFYLQPLPAIPKEVTP